jgi:hypothetical protein
MTPLGFSPPQGFLPRGEAIVVLPLAYWSPIWCHETSDTRIVRNSVSLTLLGVWHPPLACGICHTPV